MVSRLPGDPGSQREKDGAPRVRLQLSPRKEEGCEVLETMIDRTGDRFLLIAVTTIMMTDSRGVVVAVAARTNVPA